MSDAQTTADTRIGYINLPPRFDLNSSGRYKMSFAHLLADASKEKIIANFAGVDYVDSMAVGTLIAWHKSCEEQGKELVMKNCGDRVMHLFKSFSFDQLFHIVE